MCNFLSLFKKYYYFNKENTKNIKNSKNSKNINVITPLYIEAQPTFPLNYV